MLKKREASWGLFAMDLVSTLQLHSDSLHRGWHFRKGIERCQSNLLLCHQGWHHQCWRRVQRGSRCCWWEAQNVRLPLSLLAIHHQSNGSISQRVRSIHEGYPRNSWEVINLHQTTLRIASNKCYYNFDVGFVGSLFRAVFRECAQRRQVRPGLLIDRFRSGDFWCSHFWFCSEPSIPCIQQREVLGDTQPGPSCFVFDSTHHIYPCELQLEIILARTNSYTCE